MIMSNERVKKELVLTVEDFSSCGWKTVLAEADRKDYFSMFSAFSVAAKQATDENRQTHSKALRLLAKACSMMLSPNSLNEPFKPSIELPDRRSTIPDDLSETDIAFFAEIADTIDDPWLKARLADLVWLKQRESRFALMAIDAYRAIPLSSETWLRDGDKCWERAIVLSLMLRGGARDRLAQIEASIIDIFKMGGEDFFCLWLAELLKSKGLGKDHSTMIAEKLESLGREFKKKNDFNKAGQYFQVSADWFEMSADTAKSAEMSADTAKSAEMSADTAKSAEMKVEWAETSVKKATADRGSLVAVHFYDQAIQIYRSIPRSERAKYGVNERIAELRAHLSESGEQSLDEMGVISTPKTDISQIVEDARNAVKGKELFEALKAFVNIDRGVNVKDLRERVIKRSQNSISALFPSVSMSQDGRVISKHPGINVSPDDDEIGIHSQMIQDYQIAVSLVVQGCIWPALEILLLEHRLQEADFINLARQSPIVPIGRERLFGKALYAGYDRDFVTALHILVPQIEHMVRFHLKARGVSTTNLDSNGIENENGLSTLMDFQETKKIFGENLSFEIKALFCDPVGANLRNELAHGLIDYEACYSPYAIYAWWLGLQLVFNAFWNARHTSPKSNEPESERDESSL